MAEISRVSAGDESVPAASWNEIRAIVNQLKEQLLGNKVPKGTSFKHSGIVKVLNVGGSTLDQFDVVGLREAAFDPTGGARAFLQNPVVFKGSRPNCDHVGKFAVLLQPIKDGEVGLAIASGIAQVQIEIENEDHLFADITPDDASKLTSCENGSAQILWHVPGTGKRWSVVRISNSPDGPACVSSTTTSMETTTGTTGTEEGTTGTGTTGEGTTGTGEGSSTTTTGEGGTGSSTTTTDEGGGGSSTTTTGEGGTGTSATGEGTTTTTSECPVFDCSGECQVSIEVVTDVTFDLDTCELTVTKSTICLPSSQVSL